MASLRLGRPPPARVQPLLPPVPAFPTSAHFRPVSLPSLPRRLTLRGPRRVPPIRQLRARADSQQQDQQAPEEKVPFGYTRKDVIIIGVGLTAAGFALRYGLEYGVGLDPLQSGTITQLVVVIGLCVGWISTYLWRVGNKEMTYAKQLRDYESAVMQKRLEAMSETDLEAMLAEVEEEKQRLREKRAKLLAKKSESS